MEEQVALEVDPTYCIIHGVVKGLVLGEETTRTIWGMGELGAMDEVIHRGTSSNSTPRGVPVREVKVPLAVVTVALKNKKTLLGLADLSDESLLLQISYLFKVVT